MNDEAKHWKANHDCQVELKRRLSTKYGLALKRIQELERELVLRDRLEGISN